MTVKLYACGGGGINVASVVALNPKEDGLMDMDIVYVDTSRSNLKNKDLSTKANTYIYEGIDGSGKVRAMNYDEIVSNMKAVLNEHKPTAFNIVLHTASGGSGSVLGPVLVSELKHKGHECIVLLIGSTDTKIEIENTIKTLKSYEAIAKKTGSPVVAVYIENGEDGRRSADAKMIRHICLTASLLSPVHMELDTADLKNWLNFTKVTSATAKLASLTIATTPEEMKDLKDVISVATLCSYDLNSRVEPTPAYQCVGFTPNSWRTDVPGGKGIIGDSPIHFCISDNYIVDSVTKLSQKLKELDQDFQARNERKSLVEKTDHQTDEGIIL